MDRRRNRGWLALLVALLALTALGVVAVGTYGPNEPSRPAAMATSAEPSSSPPASRRDGDRPKTDRQRSSSASADSSVDQPVPDGDGSSTRTDGRGAGESVDEGPAADPDYGDGVDEAPDDGYEGVDGGASLDAWILAGQWYTEPSYGGAETYTILTVDYDGAQRGGRAFWPNGVTGGPLTMAITGGNEYPFLWELSGDLLTLQFYSGRVESYRIVSYDEGLHEMWVDDGAEVRLFVGCRSGQWPLPAATAPGC